MEVIDYYWHYFWSIRDTRVDGWPLMDSPQPTIFITALYLFVVMLLGPYFMKNREPFQMKSALVCYNVVQIVVSFIIVVEGFLAGWGTEYSWICQDVDRSENGLRMARISWIYFLVKFFEYLDTIFFVLRKKFNQITCLHVYHHAIMPLFGFALVRWLPGGQESFAGVLNSFVHVVMYTYYLLAGMGPYMKKYLWWKKYVTIFQIVQFVIALSRSLIVVFGIVECGYPWQFSAMSATIMMSFLVLFSKFYIDQYLLDKNTPKNRNEKKNE